MLSKLSKACSIQSSSDILGAARPERRLLSLGNRSEDLKRAAAIRQMQDEAQSEDPDDDDDHSGGSSSGGWVSNSKAPAKHKEAEVSKPADRDVIVLGLPHSGTKYMLSLIQENLEKPNGVQLCHKATDDAHCGKMWAHTHPSRLEDIAESAQDPACTGPCMSAELMSETIAVAVVRHPFSLIRSWQQSHDDLDCGNLATNDPKWITQSCTFLKDASGSSKVTASELCASVTDDHPCFKNLVEGWNSFMQGIMKIQKLFYKVVVIRYEDAVARPHAALRELATVLSLTVPNVNSIMLGSLPVAQNAGRYTAVQKLQVYDYGSNYTDQERYELCSELDKNALYLFGYTGCQLFFVPFWQRIYGIGAWKADKSHFLYQMLNEANGRTPLRVELSSGPINKEKKVGET